MRWLSRLDAWGHTVDAKYEAWLDRHVSPAIDAFFDWGIPLIVIAGVTALAYALASG
jgi:hypothetical protein